MRHRIGTREEWAAARGRLLVREKELTRLGDELAAERRALPWVPVEKSYTFDTDDGERTLPELFDGRTQLLLYHFMFGADYTAGCPTNSTIADAVDGLVPHVRARDVSLVFVSRAPVERLLAYRRRMGWSFPWVSSGRSDFNVDFGVSVQVEQLRESLAPVMDSLPPIDVLRLREACTKVNDLESILGMEGNALAAVVQRIMAMTAAGGGSALRTDGCHPRSSRNRENARGRMAPLVASGG